MSLADLIIIGVMGGRDFQCTRAERRIHVIVGNDRYRPVDQRDEDVFANQPVETHILRVYCHCYIGHNRLRSLGRDDDALVGVVLQDIAQMEKL